MELSNTSKYAIRILNYIANYCEGRLVSARELSEALNISYKFLTKILSELVKEGFIISIRGREGGNKLAREASEITVMQILRVFHEWESQNQCLLGIGSCDGKNKCALHDQWLQPKKMIEEMFGKTTLKDLDGKKFKI